MSVSINTQAFVDAMVQTMLEDKDPILKAARKNVVREFSLPIQESIQEHSDKIKELKSETNGETVNAAAIKYHEGMLAFYQS